MSASPTSEAIRQPQRRVLMVEDNPSDARLIECLLAPEGSFSLDHVTTLASTRLRLLEQRYDAVLLDLTLPDGQQADTLREVSRFAEYIPIVALTGVEDDELARACIASGIQDYVFKSELSDQTLVRSLNHAISRHRAGELQRRIESAQRQISLGRVAGGVVHEVNNAATVVLASFEDIRARIAALANEPPQHLHAAIPELLAQIDQGIQHTSRMSSMADELRLFAQRESRSPYIVDVNEAVSGALRLLGRRLKLRAHVETELGQVPGVKADESKLGQVLINLLLNAADAVDESPSSERRISIETRFERPWVLIRISDTGCGIPEEYRQRIFEPFFSSKPLGKGSGLGLSICSELVTAWKGRLEVESEVGLGSCFKIMLPVASGVTQPMASKAKAQEPRTRRSARILLVDDMDGPRRAIRRLIDRDHSVEEAASTADALGRIQSGAQFDLIMCDLMMPGMDGIEFLKCAAQENPALRHRFILLTGGAFTESTQAALDQFEVPILAKPIARAVLLGAIESQLEKATRKN